jgi:UDP-2,4-diacetamido-2,4,6-trideoxy-beta-L-altropyranose hydrolase
MRCAVIANELARHGYECCFATVRSSLAFIPGDAQLVEPIVIDPHAPPEAQLDTIRAGKPFADLLVVDHYELKAEFETAAREMCRTLMVIDDFTHRRHDCDLYLNLSLDTSESDFADLLPGDCKKLLGPSYAPLRKRYSEARARAVPRPKHPARQLLITLGGSDVRDVLMMVLEGIAKSNIAFEVDLVLAGAETFPEVSNRASDMGVTLHNSIPDLVGLIEKADICIGAGGMTSWERACLGLPTLMIELAENQRKNISGLQISGAAIEMDASSPGAVEAALSSLANDEDKLASMSAAGAALCDGRGAVRIVHAVMEHASARADDLPVTE